MGQHIAIIDYGMGNLHSVAKAVEHVAAADDRITVSDDPTLLLAAERVVFPGQGAARDCMAAIDQHGLREAILLAVGQKPFLGICRGQQVLMDWSEENDGTDLLGHFPGQVRHLGRPLGTNDQPLKIPHMGWNQVRQTRPHPVWEGIPDRTRFYFVHSFVVIPDDTALIAGETDYGPPFVSAMAQKNLFAVQFHPEKSADAGLRLLRNFLVWKPT
ncbi:imidazole glycerol phosphate synthase subunit HisH [Gammaproteobacteria bacterium]